MIQKNRSRKTPKETVRREAFEVAISKEELNALPTEKFSGEIIVVEDEEGARLASEELSKAGIIGFDTETKPAFQKGQINKIALLQLATPAKCFLIRLCKLGLPDNIKSILEDENLRKVGLSIKDDFHSMAKICSLQPAGFIDLQEFVKRFLITDASLTKIHAIVRGKRISKSQQLSNWEAPVLTPKQQEYAALDALACINILSRLESGEFIPESSPYYHPVSQPEQHK